MRVPLRMPRVLALAAVCASAAVVRHAEGRGEGAPVVDLSVASIEVSQGLQTSTNSLAFVARNATSVRVKVSLNGSPAPVSGVDAVLRVYADGIEIPSSPVYSTNGPIVAPVSPNSASIDHTLNFLCAPPQSAAVTFTVTVNPFRTVAETNHANNTASFGPRAFLCRKFVDLAYVPINYPLAGGLPSAALIEPGMGDRFLRGIFKTGDWNYHRSPLPPLLWTPNVNSSVTALLNTLNDIRQNQIPAAGYARPDFVYGWLPGNPFSGNGAAISVGGSVAFGNTELSRFQRTFAHEIGHLWGLNHHNSTIGVTAFDVQHLLREPLGLAQVMPATRRDVMVAGLTTPDAWVWANTYNTAIADPRAQCVDGLGGDGGEGDGRAEPPSDAIDVLRIAGTHDHLAREVRLFPAALHERVAPTRDDPRGNVAVEGYGADGALLAAVRVDTRTCIESCAQEGHFHDETVLLANLPKEVDGAEIVRVVVREVGLGASGRVLAEAQRSPTQPEIASFAVAPAEIGPIGFDPAVDALAGMLRAEWSVTDADGDPLVVDLLYSPDGGAAWFPVAVGLAESAFEFDSAHLPASRGRNGLFRIDVRDGLGETSFVQSASSFVGANSPPDVHIIGPNNPTAFRQGATVFLHGSAWDIDEELLPEEALVWSSSIDGTLGTGRQLPVRDLAVGLHRITLRATDGEGLAAERSIEITVTQREFHTGDLNGDGIVAAQDVAALLSAWGRNGLEDLTLDGTVDSWDLVQLLSRWE
ncbi:MAG: hypothetical protein GC172_05015 [Phycisphaera sp.]|nr:hypothetical protein [Phycisphaera sp.]